jgi:hypothetical protein
MKLIRIDESTGHQYQYSLPKLENDDIVEKQNEDSSGKTERIRKMLEIKGIKQSKEEKEFINRIEPMYIYASISGYEYIKMNIVEFLWFLNIINALMEIDADELGFYGINLFVSRKKEANNSNSYELAQFEFGGHPSTISGMTDALREGLFDEEDPMGFFDTVRYL